MSKEQFIKLNLNNLQYFNDGEAPAGETETQTETEVVDEFVGPQSQSELDSVINKAVQTALKNNNAKHEAELAKAVADAVSKEKDYAELSENERAKREFEDQVKEFEAKQAEFAHKQLVVEIQTDLASKGLPIELANTFALHNNAEEALQAVGKFEETFKSAVADAVKASVRQATPEVSTGAGQAINYGEELAKYSQSRSGKII